MNDYNSLLSDQEIAILREKKRLENYNDNYFNVGSSSFRLFFIHLSA